MSKIYLLLVFLVPLCAYSQTSKPIALEDVTFDAQFEKTILVPDVKGKLINATAKEIEGTLINYTIVTPFSVSQVHKITKPSKDGTFKLSLDYAFPYQEIFIEVGDYFYSGVLVNKDLFMELDIKKLKALKDSDDISSGIKYSGTDAKLNMFCEKFLHYKKREINLLLKRMSSLISDWKMDPLTFIRPYDSTFNEMEKIEKQFISENPSPYGWVLENERLSKYYAQLCIWNLVKTMNSEKWKLLSLHKPLLVSNDGMQYYRYLIMYLKSQPTSQIRIGVEDVADIKNLTIDEKGALDSIKSYLLNGGKPSLDSLQYKALYLKLQSRFIQLMSEKPTNQILHVLDSLYPSSKADLIKLMLSSKDPIEQKYIHEQAIAGMHTGWTKKVMNKDLQQTNAKIIAINKTLAASNTMPSAIGFGEPIMKMNFGASLYKVAGIKAADFLIALKKSFSEKALAIDFWATWCSPCLAEMPYGKKLLESTKGLPLEYIYLCTTSGSSEQKWKSTIADLKQPGIHFFVEENLMHELMGQFSISGYPSYAFISKEGKYMPGAIKRPSEITKDIIVELLNKK